MPRKSDEEIESEVRRYVEKRGFEFEEEHYFRITWLNPTVRAGAERRGLIEKVGTIFSATLNGIKFPDSHIYENRPGLSGAYIYKTLFEVEPIEE